MVFHKQFNYFHIPKCGGTFISQYLEENIEGAKFISNARGDKHHPVSLKYNKVFTFSTIRNPWDWYVSFYEFNKYNYSSYSFLKGGINFKEVIKRIFGKKSGKESRIDFNVLSKNDVGILTYRFFLILSYNVYDVFRKPQSQWKEDVNCVVKIEEARNEIPQMFKKYLFPLSSKQAKVLKNMKRRGVTNRRKFKDYRKHYDNETRELIAHKESYLINRFNYNFNDVERGR